ncbi:serine incorporator 2 [Sarotherodon galilaeus]
MDVFLVLLLLSGFCVPTASFPNIYYFVNENMTWAEANGYCIKEYLGLAQITYPENNTALVNTPAGEYTGKAWIGLHIGGIGWAWLDGRPPTYYRWGPGQPLYTGPGYCVSTDYKGWYSVRCTEMLGFICFDGSNYITYRTYVTWNDAKTSCENKNSTLAQILDVETFDKV